MNTRRDKYINLPYVQKVMESTIWTEKYRPKTFEEIKGQGAIIEKIRAFVAQKNMPHLMFSGPAGVGKSTTAIVIARQLFGEEYKMNFLELNASDERGIDVVRNKVKDFARTRAMGNMPFKIIFLDESDALTKEAQQALRRTMENYTATTRFILSCNYSSKIIDPIQSRCTLFRFKPLPKEEVIVMINKIQEKEGLTIDEKAKDALYIVSKGDCRRMENILQSCAAVTKNITEDTIFSLASAAKPDEIKQILNLALNKQFVQARELLLSTMLKYGLSGIEVIKQIQAEVWSLPVTDEAKVRLVDKCGDTEFRLVEGSDEFIQLEALLANVTLYGKQ
jgi:replication factor C small subunit